MVVLIIGMAFIKKYVEDKQTAFQLSKIMWKLWGENWFCEVKNNKIFYCQWLFLNARAKTIKNTNNIQILSEEQYPSSDVS